MKRWLYVILTVAVLLAALSGCASQTKTENSEPPLSLGPTSEDLAAASAASGEQSHEAQDPIRILTIAGPTGIGMAQMMEMDKNMKEYAFEITSSPSDVMTAIVSGSVDIAACPINLASKIFAKTNGEVQMIAVNTLGVLYIVTNGVEIGSFADLDGKQIVASGEGATPEFAFKYLCEAYGIQAELQFVDEFSTAASMVASGECQIALLAEPSVSVAKAQNKELSVALDLTAIWKQAGEEGKIENIDLAQGCVIVRAAYAAECPYNVKAFLDDYAVSVAYMSDPKNLEDAAALCEAYKIVPKAAIAKLAIPQCNLVCIKGEEIKTVAESNLKVLFDYDPASVGGKMPESIFYYGA